VDSRPDFLVHVTESGTLNFYIYLAEGLRLRRIRLRALADAPDAFGSTYADVAVRPLETWAKQLHEIATFVAVKDGEDVGLVRCASDEQDHDTAWLISMWVAPESRGQGVGSALIDAVIEFTRTSGFE
jgi:GNAT superfamily N-acetyltransferase